MRSPEGPERGPTEGERPEEPCRPRTFRPPLRSLFSYPLLIWVCAAMIWFCIRFPSRWHHVRDLELIGFSIAVIFGLVYASWRAWTTRVTVDAVGIAWRVGLESGRLTWGEISELGYRWVRSASRGVPSRLEVGLVQANPHRFYVLPLFPRELYAFLRTRVGPLPPEVTLALFKP